MDLISYWAKKMINILLLIHHTPNDKLKSRGGEAIRDSSKNSILLQKIKKKKVLLIKQKIL